MVDGTTTRSPTLKLRTDEPTSSMIPTPSCPRIVPASMPGMVPRTMCRSVPQMALAVRRTIASVGCSIFGSGTSSRRMSPIPWKTTAFIRSSSAVICGVAALDELLAAGHRDRRAGHVAGVVRRQQHEDGGELGWLAGPAECHILAEVLHLLRRHGGRDQGRPDRPRGDAVGPDALLPEHLGEPSGEVLDRRLGHRIRQ